MVKKRTRLAGEKRCCLDKLTAMEGGKTKRSLCSMGKDGEAWCAAVHGVERVGHD